MTQSFISKLKQRLALPLPGEDSHHKMRPVSLNSNGLRFKNPPDPRKGAVLILFYEEQGILRFPLIQRPVYEGVHSGQMALPGGRMEPSDKDLIETALRETNEEIGLPPDPIEILGQLSSFMVAASNHLVLPVVGFFHEAPKFIPDHKEVAEVVPVALDDLVDERNVKRTTIEVGNRYQLDSPYFDLENKIVWGATAGMLSELKEVIRTI